MDYYNGPFQLHIIVWHFSNPPCDITALSYKIILKETDFLKPNLANKLDFLLSKTIKS